MLPVSLLTCVIALLSLQLANAQSDTCAAPTDVPQPATNPSDFLATGNEVTTLNDPVSNSTDDEINRQTTEYTNGLDEIAYEASFHPNAAFKERFQAINQIPGFYPNIIGCACNSTCVNAACCDSHDGSVSALCWGGLSDQQINANSNTNSNFSATGSNSAGGSAGSNTGGGGGGGGSLTNPEDDTSSSPTTTTTSASASKTPNKYCPNGNICTSFWGCGDEKHCQCLQLNTQKLWFHCGTKAGFDKRDTLEGSRPRGRERFSRRDDPVVEESGPMPCNCSYVSPACRRAPVGGLIWEPPGRNLGMVQLPDTMCCNTRTGEAQEGSHASEKDMSCQ